MTGFGFRCFRYWFEVFGLSFGCGWAGQVINADEVEDVGFCSGRIWVHRPIIDSQAAGREGSSIRAPC